MTGLAELKQQIFRQVGAKLQARNFDPTPFSDYKSQALIQDKGAFLALTDYHPAEYRFSKSCLGGSFFLGCIEVTSSIILSSDLRGDELREEEVLDIENSFLDRTVVHSHGQDLVEPDRFPVKNAICMPWTNLHGAPVDGVFLKAGATLDLTSATGVVIGEYSYIQTGRLKGLTTPPGTVWIRVGDAFEFTYQFDPEVLSRYISQKPGHDAHGVIPEFLHARRPSFKAQQPELELPSGTCVGPGSMVLGNTTLGPNVFVAQRVRLENSFLGPGANAQENCILINSRLDGHDITAHGGKLINAHLERKVFTGFNAFIRGAADQSLHVGRESIIMPHTIIDVDHALKIPPRTLVWGFIGSEADLAENSASLEELVRHKERMARGRAVLKGRAGDFVAAFQHRIEHILEENGALFDGSGSHGHAQKSGNMTLSEICPYPGGIKQGLCPDLHFKA